jgi:hypothetical protein
MRPKYVILLFWALLFCFCSKDKWEGKIYKEEGAPVIENHGAGLWGDDISSKIQFRETLSLGVEEGEEFLTFHSELDTAVDTHSNIILLDLRNHRLLKFDENGNFLWEAGRKGQGPGELQNPSQVVLGLSGEIWILDTRSLIQVFDDEGIYLRTVRLEDRGSHFQFLPDGRLLISKTTRGQMGVSADFYSQDGELLDKFPVEYRFGQDLPSWAGGSVGGGGYYFYGKSIFMVIPDTYEIRELDFEGILVKKIRRDLKLEPPEVKAYGTGFTMTTSNVMGPCFLYKNKILINSLMLIDKTAPTDYEIHNFLDFFNDKGQFLGSYKLPEETRLNAIDSENNFYFVQQSPFPRVFRAVLDKDVF